jgi:cytoskeletal protein CcmA (bactofilin family)
MKRLWVVLSLVLVATLALPLSAAAAGPHDVLLDGRVVFGGSFTLAAGETLDGDLLVFGGSATLEESSTVTGSVFLMGGNLNSAGTIIGDLALMGGNANLQAGAVVQGDVSTFGGNVNRDPGARIEGQVITGGDTIEIPGLQGVPQWQFPFVERTWPTRPMIDINTSPLWNGGWLLLQSLILAALAVLVVMFGANGVGRVSRAVTDAPAISGLVGLLGLLGIPALLIGMALTICLIPFMLVGTMVFVAAIVYGWMAIGLEVGERLTRAFKWNLDPAAAAGLGTFVVSLVANGVNFIPCIGWLAPTLVGALGLGAVLLTRFGRQAYPGRAAAVEVPLAA